jgi:dihydropteroate synthase
VGIAADGGADILRVHDVAAARDYLAVRGALANGAASDLLLDPALRREPV